MSDAVWAVLLGCASFLMIGLMVGYREGWEAGREQMRADVDRWQRKRTTHGGDAA